MILNYHRPRLPDDRAANVSTGGGPRGGWILASLLTGGLLLFRYAAVTGTTERTGAAVAKTDVVIMEEALDLYKLDAGQFPADVDGLNALHIAPPGMSGWRGPYVKRHVPADPWGNAYVYHATKPCGAKPYTLLSRGPDGVEGTADDIVNK